MGAGAVCAGNTGTSSSGTGCRSRLADRLSCLWRVAGSVSAWRAHEASQSKRGNRGHDLRVGDGTVFVALVACRFYLVGGDWNLCDIYRRICCQYLGDVAIEDRTTRLEPSRSLSALREYSWN